MVVGVVRAVTAHGLSGAGFTSAPPIAEDARVCFVEWMPVLTDSFGASAVSALAADILGSRYQLKMFWADALAYVAQVIPLHPACWLTNEEVVGEAAFREDAVAVLHNRACPKPASVGLLDLGPEALFRGAVDMLRMRLHRVLQPLGAMGQAVLAALPHHFTMFATEGP